MIGLNTLKGSTKWFSQSSKDFLVGIGCTEQVGYMNAFVGLQHKSQRQFSKSFVSDVEGFVQNTYYYTHVLSQSWQCACGKPKDIINY